VVQSLLMMVSLIALYIYNFDLTPKAPLMITADAYDADQFAPARPFMLRRDRDESSAPGAPRPGTLDRWRLAEDFGGLGDVARTLAHINSMYTVISLYNALQGVILLLLIVRLVNLISFQPKLSLISGTLARFIPDVFNFLMVFIVCVILFAAFVGLNFGYRIENVSDFGLTIATMLKFLVTGDDGGLISYVNDPTVAQSVIVGIIAVLVKALGPIVFLWIAINFVLAILAFPYEDLKQYVKGAPGVPQDLARMARTWLQVRVRRAPDNDGIGQIITTALRERQARSAIWNKVRVSKSGGKKDIFGGLASKVLDINRDVRKQLSDADRTVAAVEVEGPDGEPEVLTYFQLLELLVRDVAAKKRLQRAMRVVFDQRDDFDNRVKAALKEFRDERRRKRGEDVPYEEEEPMPLASDGVLVALITVRLIQVVGLPYIVEEEQLEPVDLGWFDRKLSLNPEEREEGGAGAAGLGKAPEGKAAKLLLKIMGRCMGTGSKLMR